MACVLIKKNEQAKYKLAMKDFMSYSNRNEDFLYNHNYRNEYMMGNNKEFIEQLEDFKNQGNLVLLKSNIKKIVYKKKIFIMLTINGDGCEGTDGATINRMAFAQNYLIGGYSYMFKYHQYKQIENDIKHGGYIQYIK